MSLEEAPEHIKLAVDLIQILEQSELPVETVIPALEIVLQDYQNKARMQADNTP